VAAAKDVDPTQIWSINESHCMTISLGHIQISCEQQELSMRRYSMVSLSPQLSKFGFGLIQHLKALLFTTMS
jgi:hypothetical protein